MDQSVGWIRSDSDNLPQTERLITGVYTKASLLAAAAGVTNLEQQIDLIGLQQTGLFCYAFFLNKTIRRIRASNPPFLSYGASLGWRFAVAKPPYNIGTYGLRTLEAIPNRFK